MIEWYNHQAVINEQVEDTKSELAALVSKERIVRSFLAGSVQYLELVKHRAIAQGSNEVVAGINTAIAEMKRLVPIQKQENEYE